MKNYKKISFLSIMLSSLFFNSSQAAKCNANQTNNYNENVKNSSRTNVDDDKKIGKKFNVKNSRELFLAAQCVKKCDKIFLESDIILDRPIFIEKSITLDLNGYTIIITNDDDRLYFGKSRFGYRKKIVIKIPGQWLYQRDSITNRPVSFWMPEIAKTEYCDIYYYFDEIDIEVRNGTIIRTKGENGCDGIKDSEKNYHGKDGFKPKSPVHIISGIVRFKNIEIMGGDGGDGGDGKYQSLSHLPFGGGNAGNGGNGGKPGLFLSFEKKHGKYTFTNDCVCKVGKPGKGGKKGTPNPNFWVWSGSEGKNGQDGER